MDSGHIDESKLRHPLENMIFAVSVLISILIVVAAIYVILVGSDWLAAHPFIAKHIDKLRAIAIATVLSIPAMSILRHMRRAKVVGNSVQLSRDQVPEIYGLLEKQCQKLGLDRVPKLYLSDDVISEPARAFSIWSEDYIVLGTDYVEKEPKDASDVIAFLLGCELGRIRLGHTKWWDEILLTYIYKAPLLKNPLIRVRTYSCDRYGAYLEPKGLRGLLVQASGRRIVRAINVDEYLNQVLAYRGFWARVSSQKERLPHISYRVKALYDAGFFDLERDLRRFGKKENKKKREDSPVEDGELAKVDKRARGSHPGG